MPDELRYAARSFRKNPGFSSIVVLVLALGIGANTAIFSAVDALLLRPLPYAQPHRLAMIWEDASAIGFAHNTPSAGNYADWKRLSHSFADMAASRNRTANLTGGGEPEQVIGRAATANFFRVLGVAPLLGRTFTEAEDTPDSRVVVIAYGLWQRRFAGEPSLLNTDIEMNGARVRVIGIMPRGFQFPDRNAEFWVPIGFTPADRQARTSHYLQVFGRLKDGVTIGEASLEMKAIAKRLEQAYPEENRRVGTAVVPLPDEVFGKTRPALLVLLAAAGFVLLIACSNVANLLLVRALGRRRELAVRLALGAGRGRIVRQMAVESLALAAAGALGGLLVARAGLVLMQKFVPPAAAHATVSLNSAVLLFAGILSLLTALLFTLAPALHTLRSSVAENLKAGGAGAVSGGSHVARKSLVVAQVALAVALSVGAGLMIRTLAGMRSFDAGFNAENLLTMRVVLPLPKYVDGARRLNFYDSVLERVRALPGVRGAGFSANLPYTSRGNTTGYRLHDGRTVLEQDAMFRPCTPDYLAVLGARLSEGRWPSAADGPLSRPVVVINETFAKAEWPGRSPLGQEIQFDSNDGRWFAVIGVVEDIYERGIGSSMKAAAYVPVAQWPSTAFMPAWLAVRTAADPKTLARAVSAAVHEVDPQQPVASIRSMEEMVDLEIGDRKQQMQMLGAFATIAVILAALGLYGVLAYSVAQRKREIGVRVALGAQAGDVLRIVAREGLGLTAAGAVLGLGAAAVLSRLMSVLLFGIKPLDPASFAGAMVVLTASAVAACWIPARRALQVDPAIALRDE